jgi:hypothetical protein
VTAERTMTTRLLASGPETQLGSKLLLSALILAVFGGLCWLMLRGYRRRAARQADLPAPPAAPESAARAEGVEGVYASTTTHGDWLDRIAVHGLGVRSNAVAAVSDAGVFFTREAAPDLFIPAGDLVGAELAPGIAGKVTGGDGVVLVTWRLGGRTLDTGFHPRARAERERLVSAINALSGQGATA